MVVFRNNVRSFDPELLEEPAGLTAVTQPPPAAEQKTPPPVVETKEEVKQEVAAPETKKTEPVKQPEAKPVPQKPVTTPPAAATKQETAKPAVQPPAEAEKDAVVYRVQILTNASPKGSYKLTIAGRVYDTYEYKYAGAYRTCVGEFSSLAPARDFQNVCRKNGHSQAFVVAFKDGVRSTDAALFR